jgi:hypothetical protein
MESKVTMSLSSKISLAIRCSLPLAGLFLTDCVVSGTAGAQARPVGQITVAGGQTTTATAYAAPAQPQTAYVGSTGYAGSTGYVGAGVGTPVLGVGMNVGGGVYAPVTSNWVTSGYAETDYVSYNMSLRARQFAAGFYPVTQLFRATMAQGQHEMVTVTAQAGRCYRIIGVGGPGVQDLDLRLRDMNNNVIDQDVATDNFPVLGLQHPLCLNWQGTFQIEIIMYAGGGQVGVQAFTNGN